MHNLQPEHLFEGIEIVIAMQQFVLCLQTESGDQAVDGLADSIAVLPQLSVVLGGCNGQGGSARFEDLKL